MNIIKLNSELETAKDDLSQHTHANASTSAAGFMTTAMVTKLNGITAEAKKITITRKTGTLSVTGDNYVDLGNGTYGSVSKGFIVGLKAYQTSNAAMPVQTHVQNQRYLRFYTGSTSAIGITYEYFIIAVL